MKYVTIDHWIGDQHSLGTDSEDDFPSLAPSIAYRKYFEGVKYQLPEGYLRLHEETTLHDGHLREVRYLPEERELSLSVDGADKTGRDYRAIALNYSGVTEFCSVSDPQKFLPAAVGGYGDWGHDEIELLENNLFKQSILFSTGIEFQITFSEFSFVVVST